MKPRRNIIFLIVAATILLALWSCSSDGEDPRGFNAVVPPDTTQPSLVQFRPEPGDTWVSVRQPIELRFTEDVDPQSVTPQSFIIDPEPGSVRQICRTEIACTVSTDLEYNTEYTVTITEDITDTSGNALTAGFSWSFRTRTAPPPPIATDVRPRFAPITAPVTLFGTGFDTSYWENNVWFNDDSALVLASSDTTITAVVPRTAVSGLVRVRNRVAYDTVPGTFEVLTPPESLPYNMHGILTVTENYLTDSAFTWSQPIRWTWNAPAQIFLVSLDGTPSEREMCDQVGRYVYDRRLPGIHMEVQDSNFLNREDCDTTRIITGFYGGGYNSDPNNDTLYLTNFVQGLGLLHEIKLVE